MTKKITPIDYTSRDFQSIRADLLSYVKRYYSDIYKDFNEASFGSLMVDTVAYVGDILSFYLDYNVNESFLDTALEYDNVVRHARQMGYKFSGTPLTHGQCTFYAMIPSEDNSTLPDRRYIPKLLKGTRVATDGGTSFTLNEDVNFLNPANEVVVARVDENGFPTFYAIKSYGTVVSGEMVEHVTEVGAYERFLRIEVPGDNISEIVEVLDSEGNNYYQVDYLSQDTVYRSIKNTGNDKTTVANILKPFAVPRRFVVEKEKERIFLQFGYGSEDELLTNSVVDPSSITLKVHGKNYETKSSFDPAKLTKTDKFGVAPSNTTLYVRYRVNTNDNSNASTGAISKIAEPIISYENRAVLDAKKVAIIAQNLEVVNEEPIMGNITLPSTEELKRRAIDTFATQSRAVTKQDYVSIIYAMPAKYGAIKRCTAYRDDNDLKRNINIYTLSESSTGKLIRSNDTIKENLKVWLNSVKMIGDTIELLDARIINLGIEFEILAEEDANKYDLLVSSTQKIVDDVVRIPEVGENFYISDIFKTLKDVEGILDVVNIRINVKSGGNYSDSSFVVREHLSPNGRQLMMPKNAIWEIKYPFNDITGTIK